MELEEEKRNDISIMAQEQHTIAERQREFLTFLNWEANTQPTQLYIEINTHEYTVVLANG